MSLEKFMLTLLYLSAIIGITLFVTLSVDIYVSVQFIVGSFSLASVVGLYAVSLLTMYFGVSLFTFFDRANSSKVLRRNVFHSVLYAVGIILFLSLWACMQVSFIDKTLSVAAFEYNLNTVLQMMTARVVLFAVGSPFIAYFTCVIPSRHQK